MYLRFIWWVPPCWRCGGQRLTDGAPPLEAVSLVSRRRCHASSSGRRAGELDARPDLASPSMWLVRVIGRMARAESGAVPEAPAVGDLNAGYLIGETQIFPDGSTRSSVRSSSPRSLRPAFAPSFSSRERTPDNAK